LNYNKIKETIKSRNFSLNFLIPKVAGMTVQGFKKALIKETLTIKALEKISEALKLPMSYWWEEESDLIAMDSGTSYESKKIEKENLKLREEMNRKNRIIDALLKQIDNPREFLTIQKLKDKKIETKTETNPSKKG